MRSVSTLAWDSQGGLYYREFSFGSYCPVAPGGRRRIFPNFIPLSRPYSPLFTLTSPLSFLHLSSTRTPPFPAISPLPVTTVYANVRLNQNDKSELRATPLHSLSQIVNLRGFTIGRQPPPWFFCGTENAKISGSWEKKKKKILQRILRNSINRNWYDCDKGYPSK